MASRVGVSSQSSGLATDMRLVSALSWARLPKHLQDALERNSIFTASEFCELFDGSEREGAGLSQDLVQSRLHGAALAALFGECKVAHNRHASIISRFSMAEAAASAVKRARHNEHLRLQLVHQSEGPSVNFDLALKAKRVQWLSILRSGHSHRV